MSLVTVQANPQVFSSVPFLCSAEEEFNKKGVASLIQHVGHLFVKHNVHEKFGLSMIHRHFDMSSKEILVEAIKLDNALSVAMPWSVEGTTAEPAELSIWKDYSLERKSLVVPKNWKFGEAGDLQPFEFGLADNVAGLVIPADQFTRELYAALRTLGVEGNVGVVRLGQRKDTPSYETTPPGKRANVTVFGKMPEEFKDKRMVQVLWYFNSDGGLVQGKEFCIGCCCHCGSHCYHC